MNKYHKDSGSKDNKAELKKSGKLNSFLGKPNITKMIPTSTLEKFASLAKQRFDDDKKSCQEWLDNIDKIEEIVKPVGKEKNYPYRKSANIKIPLIKKACYEYAARAYPEIVKDNRICKFDVIGEDLFNEKAKSGRKVAAYLNWILHWDDESFEANLDKLLVRLGVIGFLVKKTYYDPMKKKVRSILCNPRNIIVNSATETMENACVSHVLEKSLNDVIAGGNKGIYDKATVEKICERVGANSKDNMLKFVEQHMTFDLDGDNFEEPYIITYSLDYPSEVLRVVPRFKADSIKYNDAGDKIVEITPKNYFTDYHFMPSLDGSFQSIGFGSALYGLNKCANTVANQILTAGRLATLQSAIVDQRVAGLGTGMIGLEPGELKYAKVFGDMELSRGILPLDFKEPSPVLYQMLTLCIELARDLSTTNNATSGNSGMENTKTGATQAILAEAVKLHNAINKRVYRSLGLELYKIYVEVCENLDVKHASKVVGESVTKDDFNPEKIDILPVADPNMSHYQRLSSEIEGLIAIKDLPSVNKYKVEERIVKKLIADKPEELLQSEKDIQNAPPPPEAIKIQAEIKEMAQKGALVQEDQQIKRLQLALEAYRAEYEILVMQGKFLESLAKAESMEVGPQLQIYLKSMDTLKNAISAGVTSKLAGAGQLVNGKQGQQPPQGMPPEGLPPEMMPPEGMVPGGLPPMDPMMPLPEEGMSPDAGIPPEGVA